MIPSPDFTVAPGWKFIDTLDGFRKKRNVSSWDVTAALSDKAGRQMFRLATSLRADVENWFWATQPELLNWGIASLTCEQ